VRRTRLLVVDTDLAQHHVRAGRTAISARAVRRELPQRAEPASIRRLEVREELPPDRNADAARAAAAEDRGRYGLNGRAAPLDDVRRLGRREERRADRRILPDFPLPAAIPGANPSARRVFEAHQDVAAAALEIRAVDARDPQLLAVALERLTIPHVEIDA